MEDNQKLLDKAAQPPDVQDDPTLSRLLLSRVLVEEYQALQQPYSQAKEFNELRDKTECDGNTVKEIYRLMNAAQRQHVQDIRAKYNNQYRDQLAYDAESVKVIDQAVLAEVAGETEELRNDLRAEFKRKVPEIRDGSKLESLVERGVTETFKNRTTDLSSSQVDRLAAKTLRSAVCLSGGGIRSATFNLGILQGLARHGLLDKFDYLSTVSGGGFIGGWLTAWKHRVGLKTVVNELREPPTSPLEPDPKPLEHLRVYSNYLSPQPGFLSADTWTLIATVVRNVVLNWLVFVPVLLAILLVPRIWASIVLGNYRFPGGPIQWSWWIGLAAAVVALSYISLNLPSSNGFSETPSEDKYKVNQAPFIFLCLIWLIISACALSVYLWKRKPFGSAALSWELYAWFAAAIILIPWLLFIAKVLWKADKKNRRTLLWRVLIATVIIVLLQVVIGYIANAVVINVMPLFGDRHIAYSVFSPPLILLLMAVEAVLLNGFTSRVSNDDDQEWWARAGAWVLIVAVAWIAVHSLVLQGPKLLLTLEPTINNLRQSGRLSNLQWEDWGKLIATAFGIVSGVITLVGGFSSRTPANSKEADKAGTGGLLLAILTQVLAPVFLAFVIILLSLGTNWLLTSELISDNLLPKAYSPLSAWHSWLIIRSPLPLLLGLFLFLILFGVAAGRAISTNVFSLQYLWRNRIIRAYLGASHLNRKPNPFTNFDRADNLHMHHLWPQPVRSPATDNGSGPVDFKPKLFHILNMALNLTGGEKLQWQDRKAESFTVSPLHAGSYWLGYRRSPHYGGTNGITLGASVAISGAFVSPNMGFMMNSPVVRFLMALFNVRFGWWLGNPGPAGDNTNILERLLNVPAKLLNHEVKRPFRLDSPRLSVIPFLSEAIGNIDKKSSYVYLSDGGHFENLGLYEMVLRRCRFIVVCDATTDPDYSFESLAMSIRQIRVDLGVPIDMPELSVGMPSQNLKNKYCAIGKIRYSCVDRDPVRYPEDRNTCDDDYDGILVFIKASMIGDEPRDVINYWQGRSSFPQEVITDQWFSEAQFESYRALGSRIIDALCDGSNNRMNLANFAQKVEEHNSLNFRAFQDEISYFALQQAFKDGMVTDPVVSYQSKVREFMKKILR